MKWDESQHPRDPDGKFARKFSNFQRPVKGQRMESPKVVGKSLEVVGNPPLTREEWSLYYKTIDEEKLGNYVYKDNNGARFVRIETEYSNRVLIDDGRYLHPKIKEVLSFRTNDEMSDFYNRMIKRGIIK